MGLMIDFTTKPRSFRTRDESIDEKSGEAYHEKPENAVFKYMLRA